MRIALVTDENKTCFGHYVELVLPIVERANNNCKLNGKYSIQIIGYARGFRATNPKSNFLQNPKLLDV